MSASPHAQPAAVERTARDVALRTALWLLLGGWFGSWLLFGAVIAPTAFSVLPSTRMAGSLVGPILTALHLYGAVAGLGLALLARALGRGRLLLAAPLVLAALCLLSHFGVSAAVAEMGDLTFGPGGNAEAAARFGLLHRLSVGNFVAVGAAVTGLVFLHARADSRAIAP